MIRIPTLTEITDTIDNRPEAFERLCRVAIDRERAEQRVIEAHTDYYRLPITTDGTPYTLYILLEVSEQERMAIVRGCRTTRENRDKVIATADFLPNELRVHSSTGRIFPLDVVIEQRRPTLLTAVMEHATHHNTEQLRRYIGEIELLANRVEDSGIYHAKPMLDNICFDQHQRLQLRGYPLYTNGTPSNFNRGLLWSALALYLFGCVTTLGLPLDMRPLLHNHHLATLTQNLHCTIPIQKRITEIIESLYTDQIDSATLHSQLYLLAILPYENKIGEMVCEIIINST